MNIYLILGAVLLVVILLIFLGSGKKTEIRQQSRTERTETRQQSRTDRTAARQASKQTKQQQKTCRAVARQNRRRRGSTPVPSYCQ